MSRRPTIQKQIVHGTDIGLSLSTNGSDTIWLSTVTSLGIMANQSIRNGSSVNFYNPPISVDIIVKSNLLPFDYISLRENTHPQSTSHHPFLNFTIGVTGVISESTYAALLGCIDVLLNGHNVRPCLKGICKEHQPLLSEAS